MNNSIVDIYENQKNTKFSLWVNFDHWTTNKNMSNEEKKDFLLETIRTDIHTISEFLTGLGYELTMDQAEGIHYGPIIEILSNLTRGLTNTWEIVEMEFEDKAKEKAEPETKPLDLSDCSVESLSQKLSDILNNPLLPERIHNCIADELSEIHTNPHTPENILLNLNSLNKKEGGNDA